MKYNLTMTESERKLRFGKTRSDRNKFKQSMTMTGRVAIFNNGKTKLVEPSSVKMWNLKGWVLKTDLYKTELRLLSTGSPISEVACICDVSKGTLSKMFKKVYGMSIPEFRNTQK
jgi:hypothetical protein